MNGAFTDHLRQCAADMGIVLPDEAIIAMAAHFDLMGRVNEAFNLTTILDPLEAAVKHYADSLAVLKVMERLGESGRAIDVGSGPGFPGIPLAIARPQWQWVLVESRQKKAKFLTMAAEQLALRNVVVAAERSELLAQQPPWRGRFRLATGRAVASLGGVAELLAPFAAVGGMIVAMKGPKEESPSPSIQALEKLALGPPETISYELPQAMGQRVLAVFAKTAPTPDNCPRRPGMATKRPLF